MASKNARALNPRGNSRLSANEATPRSGQRRGTGATPHAGTAPKGALQGSVARNTPRARTALKHPNDTGHIT